MLLETYCFPLKLIYVPICVFQSLKLPNRLLGMEKVYFFFNNITNTTH